MVHSNHYLIFLGDYYYTNSLPEFRARPDFSYNWKWNQRYLLICKVGKLLICHRRVWWCM